ncbi:ParA family protein [Williamsoniiplasma lucivorax]|uniref:Chromosome partitioning protein n=1 Tax=Williamsoniiplasma lucivorax TaxID=209274 RepID=A0A2S5RF64_9MOLU|nr:ParA family protein [Williamsoniiplasma lucivorax]PPE05951.1 chromosome partitioning protein [Williamsoniiplasma lucivorax]
MKTITIHQNKGGVGKTTITKAIVETLAELGKKILVLDLDGQATITDNFNIDSSESYSKHWLKRANKENRENYLHQVLLQTIEPTSNPNIFVIAGGRDLYNETDIIKSQVASEKILALNLALFEQVNNSFDYLFIDLNPAWDIYVLNAYLASDSIIQVMDRSESAIKGFLKNWDDWNEKAEAYEIQNNMNGVILNRIKSDKLSKQMLLAAQKIELIEKIKFTTFIPENTNIEKSTITGGKSVVDIKTFDNWKPTKGLIKFLEEENLKAIEGNPFKNLVNEMIKKGVL